MKTQVCLSLTQKEAFYIGEFLKAWRSNTHKGGEIIIKWHNFEPVDIIFVERRKLLRSFTRQKR